MSMVRVTVGAWAVVLSVGCGGAKPAPLVASGPLSGGTEVLGPLPPLTPVAASPELFAVARITNPSKVADTAIAWSALPVNWRSMLAKEAPGVDSAAMYEAPVDFAAMLDPSSGMEPHIVWAVSYGAPSIDAAASFLRKQGGAVTPLAGGGYLVKVDSHVVCIVARALGLAPARVVCSDESESAQALTPYMTRGLPTESLGAAEVHAHVVAEPFRRRYGAQLALVRTVGVPFALRELEVDHPKFDRALRDVLYGLADEITALAYDVDRLDFDMAIEPGHDVVSVKTSLGLVGKRSWWAQMAAGAAEHQSVAPESFWKLPADATSGSFSTYSDPDRVRGVASALRELLDGWLDYQGLGQGRRTPLADAFEQVLTTGAKSAYVTLPVAPSAGPAPLGEREQLRTALGAHLLVVDQGGDKFVRLGSEMVKALGDRKLRDHLSKSKVLSGVKLPAARERAPKAVKGLPAGSKVFQVVVPANAFSDAEGLREMLGKPALAKPKTANSKVSKLSKAEDEPLTVLIVAVPDGPLTWFGFGTDEELLETRLAEARAGTGETLSRREGLGALRTEPAVSGGFSSLGAVLSRLGARLTEGKSMGDSTALGRLPHRGATPMIWRATADAQGPRLSAGVQIPKAVVEDIVAFVASRAPVRP
jgi:hypothetical protein